MSKAIIDILSQDKLPDINQLNEFFEAGTLPNFRPTSTGVDRFSELINFIHFGVADYHENCIKILEKKPDQLIVSVLTELFTWASETPKRLKDLQGVIKIANGLNKLPALLENVKCPELSEALCTLADAGDLERVKLLIAERPRSATLLQIIFSRGRVVRDDQVVDRRAVGALGVSLESNHREVADFLIAEIRKEGLLLDLVRQNSLGKLLAIKKNNVQEGANDTLINLEREINTIIDNSEHGTTLRNSFDKQVREARGKYWPPAARDQAACRLEVPDGWNEADYLRLTAFMDRADRLERAAGDGPKWARKMASIFETNEQVREYLYKMIGWSASNTEDRVLWSHKVNECSFPTKESFYYRQHFNDELFTLAMQFDVPTAEFNKSAWRQMMLKHPEMSRYLGQAPDIEGYLKNKQQPFPVDFKSFKDMLYAYSLDQLGLRNAQIAGVLSSENNKMAQGTGTTLKCDFSMTCRIRVAMSKARADAFGNLLKLGKIVKTCIAGHDTVNQVAVKLDDGVPSFDNFMANFHEGRLKRDPNLCVWSCQTMYVNVDNNDGATLQEVCDVLKDSGALTAFKRQFAQVEIMIDMRKAGPGLDKEIAKQIMADLGIWSKQSLTDQNTDDDQLARLWDHPAVTFSPDCFYFRLIEPEKIEEVVGYLDIVDQVVYNARSFVIQNSGRAGQRRSEDTGVVEAREKLVPKLVKS
jgi:hypothetical protein